MIVTTLLICFMKDEKDLHLSKTKKQKKKCELKILFKNKQDCNYD